MKFKIFITIYMLSLISSLSVLTAVVPKDVRQKIGSGLEDQKYDELGLFLKEKLDQKVVTLKELRKIAQKQESKKLLQAVKATGNFMQEGQNLELSASDFLRIALFIETSLPSYVVRNNHYLQKSKTGLARTIEYDPSNGAIFIINSDRKAGVLGRGARKVAYKAIVYNNACPKIVVQAKQRGGLGEAALTKALQGSQGILRMEGFGAHERRGKNYTSIYSKFYNAGDLQNAFDQNVQFSLVEKMQIAFNILQGLEALSAQHLVHRDLGAKNIFFNRCEIKRGEKRVEAAIADLGCAKHTKEMYQKRAQVSFKNTAPEGISFEKLRGADFFATDLYSAGLVLYRLIYGKYPAWQKRQIHGSNSYKQHRLTGSINRATKSRREYLLKQQTASQSSVEEDFELIVLHMVNPNPKKRRTATRLLQELKHIYNSAHYCIISKKKMSAKNQLPR